MMLIFSHVELENDILYINEDMYISYMSDIVERKKARNEVWNKGVSLFSLRLKGKNKINTFC